MQIIIKLVGLLFLTGCFCKECVQIPPKTPLTLPPQQELVLRDVRFIVVTDDNISTILEDLEKNKEERVLFSLTGNNYKNLSTNILDIRNFLILNQKKLDMVLEYYVEK